MAHMMWIVTLTKYRSTWSYFTTNPQGGGGGSSYCGPLYIAKARALWNVPTGGTYTLFINGQHRGMFVKAETANPKWKG